MVCIRFPDSYFFVAVRRAPKLVSYCAALRARRPFANYEQCLAIAVVSPRSPPPVATLAPLEVR